MVTKYQPPKQRIMWQVVDSLAVLVLVYIVLVLPLLLGSGPATYTVKSVENPTWETLGQSEAQAAQWSKLGFTPEEAQPIVNTRFDYSINYKTLIPTIIVIVGYFIFMLKFSDKEYRDVVAEAFDDDDNPTTRR